jgi:GT2 family glycosyltransferase
MDVCRMTERLAMACVVIGRNEGDRLYLSLRSVQQDARLPAIYVDSGSSDGSCRAARSFGISVLELDPRRPFSAARARNEGLRRACETWPDVDFVMFLDGDCVLDGGFPAAARAEMDRRTDCAIVTGHLTERHPEASVYNRLCAIEWRSPAGVIRNMNALGGIMAVRVAAFDAVGGFNEDAVAGEEPDLGVRLSLAGYSIVKIDEPMATHDAQILTFRQWWIRAVRSGHALAHRFARHGNSTFKDGRRELVSALFWGFALPLLALALAPVTRGFSLLLLAGYLLLGGRVYRHYLRTGLTRSDSWLAARHIVYGKFAQVAGIVRYLRNRFRRRYEIIEYK